MVETLVLLVLAGGAIFALFQASQNKSAHHKTTQGGWRDRVALQLNLGEKAQTDGVTLGLDKERQRLAVVYPTGTGYWIPLESLRSVEVEKVYETTAETTSTTSTDRGSQVTGAAVGTAIGGPLGGLAGALSGSRTTEAVTQSSTYLAALELKLRIRSDDMPSLILRLQEASSFDPVTKTFSGGLLEVERFVEHLDWEITKRGSGPEQNQLTPLEIIEVEARPPNTEGWWSATFGG